MNSLCRNLLALIVLLLVTAADTADADSPAKSGFRGDRAATRRRVLLVGQGPDGHAWSAHEYADGLRILANGLQRSPNVDVIVTRADGQWKEGPALIDDVDGVVLYLAEGAKWLAADANRRAAFDRLASRGGGLACLHWAMGCRDPQYIAEFVRLFGGCHGGADRKYRIAKVQAQPATPGHPICRGVKPFVVEDEFYYRLKFAKGSGVLTPILEVPLDGHRETVAWAWERPDGGRSFGFSGLHFHRNWSLESYRRLIVQGVLWSLKQLIPIDGVNVDITPSELSLRRPKPAKAK